MKTSVKVKKMWHKEGKGLSLKEFTSKKVDEGDETVMEWVDNKKGALERKAKEARQKHKGARIAAEKLASKAARRK